MDVPVNRSFSPLLESGTPETDYERRFRLANGHKSLSWSDLLEKRMVIILAEAGIGKTHEFKNKAKSLAQMARLRFSFLSTSWMSQMVSLMHLSISAKFTKNGSTAIRLVTSSLTPSMGLA